MANGDNGEFLVSAAGQGSVVVSANGTPLGVTFGYDSAIGQQAAFEPETKEAVDFLVRLIKEFGKENVVEAVRIVKEKRQEQWWRGFTLGQIKAFAA